MSSAAAFRPGGTRDRLQAYSRLLELLEEQAEALEQGDAARVWELGERRRHLEEELAITDLDAGGTAALERELRLLVEERRDALDQQIRSRDELRDVWIQLREEALSSARSMRIRSSAAGRYTEAQSVEAQLDVRF